ncbi:MAG: hypothetical protein KBI34_08615, partial [Dictyoglomi bacterium]|nr:hypothetical protein [Dictyoglomota bacterium]
IKGSLTLFAFEGPICLDQGRSKQQNSDGIDVNLNYQRHCSGKISYFNFIIPDLRKILAG